MKKILITAMMCASACSLMAQEGFNLWLPGQNCQLHETPIVADCQTVTSATLDIAKRELQDHWLGNDTVWLVVNPSLQLGEGYHITVSHKDRKDGHGSSRTMIETSQATGLLYGIYDLLRMQSTGCFQEKTEYPAFDLRLLNHWDNLDGSVERGYAGKSIWKWEEIGDSTMSDHMQAVVTQYARANTSIGINGTVLNNVNASPKMLTSGQLKKVRVLADALRPYGIRVFLSINFATPMALGDTPTADPLDPQVRAWWQAKANEIYALIPDFGGFLVKANSEGQPGPGDYGRTHADGANMLGDALRPHGGIVMWRSFVYGANHKGEDRVKQAVSEFKPCDGKFAPNVILQSKNGPLDFQPREPYAPIFDQMEETPQMVEFQITQEYTGQSRHLVYLAPMWKEFFSFVAPERMVGIAGVANIGDDSNWCGHPFSQANWYAYGRLAWNPQLSSEEIADEWLKQTFPGLTSATSQLNADIRNMMLTSREACVDYMMPLGLHHIFKFDHHYGPEPDGFKAEYPLEWCPVYYHQADKKGVGFDRTAATGTGATAQYREPYADIYNKVETCPEEYLLWFHHLPWKYKMKNGKTLWQNLCLHYDRGIATVASYRQTWQSARPYIDDKQWTHVDNLLNEQFGNACEWRDVCLNYFRKFSRKPIYQEK